jgi:hypothetical protein
MLKAAKSANAQQTIPTKGKKANMDSSEESSDEGPKVMKMNLKKSCSHPNLITLIYSQKTLTKEQARKAAKFEQQNKVEFIFTCLIPNSFKFLNF